MIARLQIVHMGRGHGGHGHRGLARLLRARRHRAHSAIVGGTEIPVESAPWQVTVFAFFTVGEEELVIICGGSILNESEVLTAGHCVYNPATESRLPAGQIVVLAGASHLQIEEATDQVSLASNVRVHPYFAYNAGATHSLPDDVAVLKLKTPIVFAASAQSIGLAPVEPWVGEGTAVKLTGFGQQNPEARPNGNLYSIGMTLGESRQCGGEADAVFLCAHTPTGSLCHGDSGSGLTLSGALLGVANTVQVIEGKACRDGAYGGFADVAAPEIRDFVEGSEAPPLAPRGGGAAIHGVPVVGQSLSCEPGSWSGSPAFIYEFVDGSTGQVLARGTTPTYAPVATDVGRTIVCRVLAQNPGGTGVARTLGLGPVEAAPVQGSGGSSGGGGPPPPPPSPPSPGPPPPPSPPLVAPELSTLSLAGTSISVQSNGVASVELECLGTPICRGTLTLSAKRALVIKGKRVERTVPIGSARFSIPGFETMAVKLRLGAYGRSLLSVDHGHVAARLALLGVGTNPTQVVVSVVHLVQQRSRGRR